MGFALVYSRPSFAWGSQGVEVSVCVSRWRVALRGVDWGQQTAGVEAWDDRWGAF